MKALEATSVRRICSGQVVVDLATAVKELVENAIDAGATKIEIKLKENGLDSIEVCDNGCGIAPAEYDFLMRHHFTSKIKNFEDIQSVSSFGFRGEALTSLLDMCPDGGLCMVTKREEDKVGTRLFFNHDGSVKSQNAVARATGTTVTIEGLFKPLPVRRKEFQRTIKSHYSKLVLVLQGYAIISTGVKISCVNVCNKVKRNVMQTTGCTSIKENITSVCGITLATNLVSVHFELRGEKSFDTSNLIDTREVAVEEADIQVEGFVSKFGEGIGLATSDRQFWFINGRPVDIPKASKVLNMVWRQHEMKHKPAFFLNWKLPPGSFDINVTPNKREVFLVDEVVLFTQLQKKFESIWQRQTTLQNQSAVQQTLGFLKEASVGETDQDCPVGNTPGLEETNLVCSDGNTLIIEETGQQMVSSTSSVSIVDTSQTHQCFPKGIHPSLFDSQDDDDKFRHDDDDKSRQDDDDKSRQDDDDKPRQDDDDKFQQEDKSREEDDEEVEVQLETDVQENIQNIQNHQYYIPEEKRSSDAETDDVLEALSPIPVKSAIPNKISNKAKQTSPGSPNAGSNKAHKRKSINEISSPSKRQRNESVLPHETEDNNDTDSEMEDDIQVSSEPPQVTSGRLMKQTGMDDIKAALEAFDTRRAKLNALQHHRTTGEFNVPGVGTQNSRVFSKDDFAVTQVLGQFNKGFMVGRVDQQLFIFDQHACDEKYRFETLQKSTLMKQQPLIRPFPLQLDASEIQIVQDNLDIFLFNGFKFSAINDRSISLVSIPHRFKAEFGAEDVRELASIVRESPPPPKHLREALGYVPPRLPRARAMFASRACRSAIMIGDTLDRQSMCTVLGKMTGLEQPWNCPHGRPTMRHLTDLSELYKDRGIFGDSYVFFDSVPSS